MVRGNLHNLYNDSSFHFVNIRLLEKMYLGTHTFLFKTVLLFCPDCLFIYFKPLSPLVGNSFQPGQKRLALI